jgi:hypothetical protein
VVVVVGLRLASVPRSNRMESNRIIKRKRRDRHLCSLVDVLDFLAPSLRTKSYVVAISFLLLLLLL